MKKTVEMICLARLFPSLSHVNNPLKTAYKLGNTSTELNMLSRLIRVNGTNATNDYSHFVFRLRKLPKPPNIVLK